MPRHSGDAPKAAVSRGRPAAAKLSEQSNVSGSDRHLTPTTLDHLFGPSVATTWSHFNIARNGQRLHVLLGSEEEDEDARMRMDAGLRWRQTLHSDT